MKSSTKKDEQSVKCIETNRNGLKIDEKYVSNEKKKIEFLVPFWVLICWVERFFFVEMNEGNEGKMRGKEMEKTGKKICFLLFVCRGKNEKETILKMKKKERKKMGKYTKKNRGKISFSSHFFFQRKTDRKL